jgi:hypothetical protein
MATAEYSFPELDEPETRPLSMPAQLLVVVLGTLVALAVGVLLVLAATS